MSIPSNPLVPVLEVTETYDFFRETSAQFSRLGFASKFNGIPIPMKYDNPEIIYQFPITYAETWASTSYTDADITGFGYYQDPWIPTGIKKLSPNQKPEITLFPNPTSGYFTIGISFSNPGNANIEVSDLSGRIVFTKNVGQLPGGIHLERIYLEELQLSGAIYLVKVTYNENSYYKKLIYTHK